MSTPACEGSRCGPLYTHSSVCWGLECSGLPRWLEKLQENYSRLILKVLQHKGWVLAGALVLFVASMVLSVSKGTEFFPAMESTQATMTITTEKGTPVGIGLVTNRA